MKLNQMVTATLNFNKDRNLIDFNSSFITPKIFSNMKLTTVLLFLLLSSVAYTQCVQCGGSRVDIKFTNATITDTNGIDSTLSGEFIYLLDFKNSTPYLLSNFHFNIFKFKHLNL